MNRNIFDLGRVGNKKFQTTNGLKGQNIGIIGFGRIGTKIAEMIKVFEPASIFYFSRTRQNETETRLGVVYREIRKVFSLSDVIFLCVPKDAGVNFINEDLLSLMKTNSLIVNITHPGILDQKALLEKLKNGSIRAISDHPFTIKDFDDLPLNSWYCFNGSNAFNTFSSIQKTSDVATKSLINLVETGKDKYKVN